jgi:hypothetical protein
MNTDPINTTAAAARHELQELVDDCRHALRLLAEGEIDPGEARGSIADALAAIQIAEVLGQVGADEAAAWRLACCNPATSTPVEDAEAALARHGVPDLQRSSETDLRRVQIACLAVVAPGARVAADEIADELYYRAAATSC